MSNVYKKAYDAAEGTHEWRHFLASWELIQYQRMMRIVLDCEQLVKMICDNLNWKDLFLLSKTNRLFNRVALNHDNFIGDAPSGVDLRKAYVHPVWLAPFVWCHKGVGKKTKKQLIEEAADLEFYSEYYDSESDSDLYLV